MQTLVIDTNNIIKKLEQRGFSRTQAEGITQVLQELDTSPLATKADLKDAVHTLQVALANSTTNLIIWMTGALLAQGALVVGILQYLR